MAAYNLQDDLLDRYIQHIRSGVRYKVKEEFDNGMIGYLEIDGSNNEIGTIFLKMDKYELDQVVWLLEDDDDD